MRLSVYALRCECLNVLQWFRLLVFGVAENYLAAPISYLKSCTQSSVCVHKCFSDSDFRFRAHLSRL